MRTMTRTIPFTRKLVVSIKDFLLGGTAAFNPASLFTGGFQGGWYDPSDLSTLWQDSARTTPVTADGQPVGCIDDKSGNGNHLTQATAGRRPLYKTSGGLHWLLFDGIDDCLTSASSFNMTSSDKASIFTGLSKVDNTVRMVCELSADMDANAGAFFVATGTANGFTGHLSKSRGAGSNSSLQTAGANASGADSAVVTCTHDIAGDLSTLRRNTVAGTSGVADKGTGNFGSYTLFVGARNNASLRFNGKLNQLIIVGKIATTPEIADTETFINGKTGAY